MYPVRSLIWNLIEVLLMGNGATSLTHSCGVSFGVMLANKYDRNHIGWYTHEGMFFSPSADSALELHVADFRHVE